MARSNMLLVAGGVLAAIVGFLLIDNYNPLLSIMANVMRADVQLIPRQTSPTVCVAAAIENMRMLECGFSIPYRFVLIGGIVLVVVGAARHFARAR